MTSILGMNLIIISSTQLLLNVTVPLTDPRYLLVEFVLFTCSFPNACASKLLMS